MQKEETQSVKPSEEFKTSLSPHPTKSVAQEENSLDNNKKSIKNTTLRAKST